MFYFSMLELTYDDPSFRVCALRKNAEVSIVEGAAYVDSNPEPGARFIHIQLFPLGYLDQSMPTFRDRSFRLTN